MLCFFCFLEVKDEFRVIWRCPNEGFRVMLKFFDYFETFEYVYCLVNPGQIDMSGAWVNMTNHS